MGSESAPWWRRRREVTSVRFEGKVNAADCSYMFDGRFSLASLDLSGLDTSSVTNMDGMFAGCSSLATLDLSGWDVSSVEDMSGMFYGCSSLNDLDIPSWAPEKLD
jgi:surface protein